MKFFFCLLCLVFTQVGEAKPILKIAIFEIPGLAHKEGRDRGFFIESSKKIFKKLERELSVEFQFDFYPPLRAHKKFREREVFALVPAFEPEVDSSSYLRSTRIGTKVDFIFHRSKNSPEQLLKNPDYLIAYVRGYYHPPSLLEKHKGHLLPVENMLAGIRMLKKERVDMLLGDSATTVEIMLKQKLTGISLKATGVQGTDAYFWAHKTELGKKFINRLDQLYLEEGLYKRFLELIDSKVNTLRSRG